MLIFYDKVVLFIFIAIAHFTWIAELLFLCAAKKFLRWHKNMFPASDGLLTGARNNCHLRAASPPMPSHNSKWLSLIQFWETRNVFLEISALYTRKNTKTAIWALFCKMVTVLSNTNSKGVPGAPTQCAPFKVWPQDWKKKRQCTYPE